MGVQIFKKIWSGLLFSQNIWWSAMEWPMLQGALHFMLWSHIGILIRFLAAERKIYILRRGRCKLNAMKKYSSWSGHLVTNASKILKEINGFAICIKLTLSILMQWLWNMLRNLTIHFHISSNLGTCLIRVTISTLW